MTLLATAVICSVFLWGGEIGAVSAIITRMLQAIVGVPMPTPEDAGRRGPEERGAGDLLRGRPAIAGFEMGAAALGRVQVSRASVRQPLIRGPWDTFAKC